MPVMQDANDAPRPRGSEGGELFRQARSKLNDPVRAASREFPRRWKVPTRNPGFPGRTSGRVHYGIPRHAPEEPLVDMGLVLLK